MLREEKQIEIETLVESFRKAEIALCADYLGLNVAQITALRKDLRKAQVTGKVVKNTLAKLSIQRAYKGSSESEIKKFLDVFEGPSFLMFSYEDPITPPKTVHESISKGTQLRVKGAWVEGSFVDAVGVESLAKMPGKMELLAQLLSIINAPARQLVTVLSGTSRQVVQVLEARRSDMEKKAA